MSVPGEGLFLEMGICPMSWILKARRVVFLHYLVTLSEEQMLSRFFWAQWKNPVRGDWTETVKKDLQDLEMNVDLDQIRKIKKEPFKSLVKKACRKAAFNFLIGKKNEHSKMRNLTYTNLSMQDYLTSSKIHPGKAKILFLARVRMLRVSNNYRQSNADLNCPVCSASEIDEPKYLDDQHHLLHCAKLVDTPPVANNGNCCKYEDIFSNNIDAMGAVADELEKSLNKRDTILAKKQGC